MIGLPRPASIFRRGSRTFFHASLFFPSAVRADVFALYAFVRAADDFVDRLPQDAEGFHGYVDRYRSALAGEGTGDPAVDEFVALLGRRGLDPAWVEAFLASMGRDLEATCYATLADLREYIYGSAEVVGLMMARILGLPEAAMPFARRMGLAMQYVNFLRDVSEDHALGRTYIPQEVLAPYGLTDLSRASVLARREAFREMMRAEVQRYRRWQTEAEEGYLYIPVRYRVPIRTAAEMYRWTADRIASEPLAVLDRRIRPSAARVVSRAVAVGLASGGPPRHLLSVWRRCRT